MSAATTLRLYEATDALSIVRDFLLEAGGELTPEVEALLAEAHEQFDVKAERVALFVRELLASAAAVKTERERLQAMEHTLENGAKNLKGYLHRQMVLAGVQRVDGQLAKVRIQANSQPAVTCTLEQEALRDLYSSGASFVEMVPATYKLSAPALLAALKLDPKLAVPDGIAIERGSHVRIS